MKLLLIAMFFILLASGSQARQIPADSLYEYYENTNEELSKHLANFNQITQSLLSQGSNITEELEIYNVLIRSKTHFSNIVNFFLLIDECDNTSLTCSGLTRNCTWLAVEIQKIQLKLSFTERQLTAVQGNDAKKFLERVLTDFVDSIVDDDCRKQVRESVANARK